MKKIYNSPVTSVICVQHSTDIMTTSRFSSPDGESYEHVKEDGDGDTEPTPMAKYDAWNVWGED